MDDKIAREIRRQLAEGNGADDDKTRGMTLRELVLELRNDQKNFPTRKEVYSVLGVLSTLITGVILSAL